MEEFKSLIFAAQEEEEDIKSPSVREFSRYISRLNTKVHSLSIKNPALLKEGIRE